ncbi:uncharacterized protein SCDLUD_000916 [Saccharomycodes ludwigii]|uniref:uncharacterized protein n=1 Tax=Saccharomycodes ludwigii TaxID=36035 RepID=UPI001E88D5CC|nr:hypothetical protein SCDLUD_000916 [Saccharomycodes ludwigii]KAH3903291.1 hypothetical protein SCDLUD_000916 [Saccharomycodes ludwigii]
MGGTCFDRETTKIIRTVERHTKFFTSLNNYIISVYLERKKERKNFFFHLNQEPIHHIVFNFFLYRIVKFSIFFFFSFFLFLRKAHKNFFETNNYTENHVIHVYIYIYFFYFYFIFILIFFFFFFFCFSSLSSLSSFSFPCFLFLLFFSLIFTFLYNFFFLQDFFLF